METLKVLENFWKIVKAKTTTKSKASMIIYIDPLTLVEGGCTVGTLRKLYFQFLSHWMGYDHGDSFPFDSEPNWIPFGSKSKGKLSPRSYPIQFERKWNASFLSADSIEEKLQTQYTLHAEKYFRNQTENRLYLPFFDWFGTANVKYNLISLWFNKISKRFIGVNEHPARYTEKYLWSKPILGCNYTFSVALTPNGLLCVNKSIRKG